MRTIRLQDGYAALMRGKSLTSPSSNRGYQPKGSATPMRGKSPTCRKALY